MQVIVWLEDFYKRYYLEISIIIFFILLVIIFRACLVNFFKKHALEATIPFFFITFVMFFFHPQAVIFNFIIVALGSILVALKYKIDQSEYNKSLFEKIFGVFHILQEALHASIQQKKDWRYLKTQLDTVYRESVFLFSLPLFKTKPVFP